jgi:hypothetical protein
MAMTITSQLHGYQHGHQLLSSTAKISKGDQAVIDRISDVAGPLRPGETFSPYLTAYPLPSGDFFVLARTWQDLSVPRAGCVRTLSLLVPVDDWSNAPALDVYLDILDPSAMPTVALTSTLPRTVKTALPPVPSFAANELLEAIFLEETKPVAMFDAPEPELIAIRLLTALWPSMRRRFAVSTFALSPRKIEGRSFDLVFAPKDARSRFASWDGRRIDARTGPSTRHRWTRSIADRVFHQPKPQLLSHEEIRLVGSHESGSYSALRIALMWEELKSNLERSPSAALGLLDIANSRTSADPEIVASLQPAILEAAHRAVTTLSSSEAWELIGALAKKIHGSAFASALPSIGDAAGDLTAKSPSEAIALIEQPDPQGAIATILPQIANGLSAGFGSEAAKALVHAAPTVLPRLLRSGGPLAETIASNSALIEYIADILPQLPAEDFETIREVMMPFLVRDFHRSAFEPLAASLDGNDLLAEVSHLAEVNSFAAPSFIQILADRARETGTTRELRGTLLNIKASPGRDSLLAATLDPRKEDIAWLLAQTTIASQFKESQLLALLRQAQTKQFASIFSDDQLAEVVLSSVPDSAQDLLLRVTTDVSIPLRAHLAVVSRLLPIISIADRDRLVWSTIERCLREHFADEEAPMISSFINLMGNQLDVKRLVGLGLGRDLEPALISRNLLAFEGTSNEARNRILYSIDNLASALAEHYTLELDQAAGTACAQMFADAQVLDPRAKLRASGRLLPTLLRSGHSPVSRIIANTFPQVYRELAKEDDIPDFLRFIPFFDWDRCKSARRELVDAFLRSRVWTPSDLAMTAFYAGDLPRFLRRIAKAYGGEGYIRKIVDGIEQNPAGAQGAILRAVTDLYDDWPAKYDWRD